MTDTPDWEEGGAMTDKQAVEKVARALYVLWRGSGRIWEDTSPRIKTQFRKDARAAIAAYHEHLGFDPKDVVADENAREIASEIDGILHAWQQTEPCYIKLVPAIAQALRDERERCAKIAETTEREGFGGGAYNEAGRDIAAAIRNQKP